MTPRPARFTRFARPSLVLTAAVALLALAIWPAPAQAHLDSVVADPAAPTTCDPVTLTANGTMPDPCYTLIGAEIRGPVPLPTASPLPTYAIRIRLTVQEPDPAAENVCITVLQPYTRSFPLGMLPFGHYQIHAVEYLVPFSSDSAAAPKDSSVVEYGFDVTASPECPPGEGCYLLGFGPLLRTPDDRPPDCNGGGPPGGRACLDATLETRVPVGGLQATIDIIDPRLDPNPQGSPLPADQFRPISVDPTPRAAGFQVAWTADGSRIKALLFSPTGALIPPGGGPVLHVCYAIGAATAPGVYGVVYRESVVADSAGQSLPACPTFAQVVGRLCVFPPSCDLNGDGASDIRDIIHLVHCALAGHGGTDACPDSIAQRADCNKDGVLDVRDVICCVRRILAGGGFGWGGPPPDSTTAGATRIGFLGPVTWTSPTEGRASIRVEPGDDFAGLQLALSATGATIRDMSFEAAGSEGYALEWGPGPNGGAVAMIYATGGTVGSSPFTVDLRLEPLWGAPSSGTLRIASGQSATSRALAAPTRVTTESVQVPAAPAPSAPMVMAPRPNPFATSTEIAYALPAAGRVTLRIYDASGRLVRTLVDAQVPAGVHRVSWDGTDRTGKSVRSGIYFARFRAGRVERTDRVLRLR